MMGATDHKLTTFNMGATFTTHIYLRVPSDTSTNVDVAPISPPPLSTDAYSLPHNRLRGPWEFEGRRFGKPIRYPRSAKQRKGSSSWHRKAP